MKRQFLILIAIAAFATALTTNAFGQTGNTVRANVKFDFQIDDRIYPAGEYWVESISQSNNLLRIRSVSDVNKQQFIVANHSKVGKRQTPKLVFQKSGENYFLTKIFLNLALASRETIEVRLANKKGIQKNETRQTALKASHKLM